MRKIFIYITCIAALTALAVPAWSIGVSMRKKEVPVPTLLPVPLPVPTIKFASPVAMLVYRLNGTDLVIDTAVAKNRIFNYRLSVECGTFTARREYLFRNVSFSVNRMTCASTFGFGLWRSRTMRIWAGPQIALSYEFSNKDSRILDTFIYNKAGGVIGINFHTGESTTVSFEVGFRAGFGYDLKKSVYNTITLSRPEPMAALKLIFRAGDTYVPSGV